MNDLLDKSAEFLNGALFATKPQSFEDYVSVINTKTVLFNVSTIALVSAIVYGILGTLSSLTALIGAGCFLFLREVADRSYNISVLPGVIDCPMPKFIKQIAPNIYKPDPLLTFGNTVILYKYVVI